MKSLCGLDCDKCPMAGECKGCADTEGRPFGGACMVAECRKGEGCPRAGKCLDGGLCRLKLRVMVEVNALHIPGMEEVTELYALRGAFINLTYTLPGGQQVRFWEDDRVYLGTQLEQEGSRRCFGITADETRLLVCEYGENGADPEIVLYKRRG